MHNKEVILSKFEYVSQHVLQIKEYTKSIKNSDDYEISFEGVTLFDATMMRLQALGENLKQIELKAPEFLERHSEIDWEKIIRFRDFISHHYEKLESEIIFEICTVFIPKLELVINAIILEITNQNN